MNTRLNNLLDRLLRTESLATIAGFVLFVTGRVETMEEALALGAVIGPLVLGRSVVKVAAHLPSSDSSVIR